MPDDALDFDRIYIEHRPRIHRYLSRLVGVNDAEDLTQETFIRVGQGLTAFNKQSSVLTWIYQIATNVAADRFRSRAFKKEIVTDFEAGPPQVTNLVGADTLPSTEAQLVRKEMNDCIQSYVDFLPENYRAVMVLSETEGMKDSEIAAILGLSLNAVKIRLHRAREKLRQEFIANCNFYHTDCNQLACEPKGPIRKKP